MKSEFEMSEWTEGESDFILNIRIDRDWEAGTVKISQPAAISKLAAKFHLDDITKTGARPGGGEAARKSCGCKRSSHLGILASLLPSLPFSY